jgi:ABC-2 type transport system ATP-binding protein
MALLEIQNLTKAYRRGELVNDDVSLSIDAGEVFGLLGPNGAGKTTLVKQIIGLLAPTSGTIEIAGVDIVAKPSFARQSCSFQLQSQVPIDGLTPVQAIELVGRIRGSHWKEVRQRVRELIEVFELHPWANTPGSNLSGGVRRLVAFGMAAVVPGKVMILDEPTNDVDPLRRRLLWKQVRSLADDGAAVLLVTHNVLEAERSVDRLAIIDRGRVIGQGTPASMKEGEADRLRLELTFEPQVALPPMPAFLFNPVNGGRRLIGQVRSSEVGLAVAWASRLKSDRLIEEYAVGPATLEDVYLRKIGRTDALESNTLEVV